MHIGQNCKVRWQTEQESDTFMWHNAMIKSIEGDTITVIWEKGQWEGCESDRIPLDWVIVRDDITSVREDVAEVKERVSILSKEMKEVVEKREPFFNVFLTKLDGINARLDMLNSNLQRHWAMQNVVNYDEVNYDVSRLKESLNSLGSVHMYSGDEEDKKKYLSNPEMPLFDRYKNASRD
tara:strand:+ start:255 stop:794 length:540 start_codon:yes stop_codon:yes gene_type:complete